MKSAPHDPCLLYTEKSTQEKCVPVNYAPRAMACLQTDDTVILANVPFIQLEGRQATAFKSKPLDILKIDTDLKFNGAELSYREDNLLLRVPKHISKLRIIQKENMSREEYVSQRARGGFIASTCRPDLSHRFSFAAQFVSPQPKDFKLLNNTIQACLDTENDGLKFVPLDLSTMFFAIFIDASFATNEDLSSQLGFVACLCDSKYNANIVHYGSSKSKRVTRSVLAAELYAMVYGFDHSSVIHVALQEFLGRRVPLRVYTDSKSLFDSLVSLNTTTEKRLLIDLTMLRECYEYREITEVLWIPGDENPSDAMTKLRSCSALSHLMKHNTLNINPKSWIEREEFHTPTSKLFRSIPAPSPRRT